MLSHPSLGTFGALLRRTIQHITNSDLSDSQWIQASLPVRDSGLGVRRVSQLASPAFIASAASTLSTQDDILNDCIKSDSEFFKSYLSAWSAKFGDAQDTLPTKQPFLDRPDVLEVAASRKEAKYADIHSGPKNCTFPFA